MYKPKIISRRKYIINKTINTLLFMHIRKSNIRSVVMKQNISFRWLECSSPRLSRCGFLSNPPKLVKIDCYNLAYSIQM